MIQKRTLLLIFTAIISTCLISCSEQTLPEAHTTAAETETCIESSDEMPLSGIELTRALLDAMELDGERGDYTSASLAAYDESKAIAPGTISLLTDAEKAELLEKISAAKSALVLKGENDILVGADLTDAIATAAELDFDREYYTAVSLEMFDNAAERIQDDLNDMSDDDKRELLNSLTSAKKSLEFISGELPRVYITSKRGITVNYGDAGIAIIDADGTNTVKIVYTDSTIRVRGNSTSGAPKKPYTFKLSEGRSLLGMGRGKRWVLLANAFDKTLLRNKMMFDFSQAIGISWASDSEFVEVWVNGEYAGNYILCEPVTDGGKRVDIDIETGNEALLELNIKSNITTSCGVPFYIDKPEEYNDKTVDFILGFLDEFEKRLLDGDVEAVAEVADIDSFINLYLMMELFKNVDGYWASTYFYINDGVLYAGPPWDFDLSCGNVNSQNMEDKYFSYCNVFGFGDDSGDSSHGFWMDQGWFELMLGIDELRCRIVERYTELQPQIINLYEDNELGVSIIDGLVEKYGDSFLNDYSEGGAGWDISRAYSPYEYQFERNTTYEEHIGFLRDWLRSRNEWLLENFAALG